MNRLTFIENDKFGVVGMNEENQDKKLYACVLKLTDYEDTGLSPNDILKLKEEQKEKDKELVVKVCEKVKYLILKYDLLKDYQSSAGYLMLQNILNQIQNEFEDGNIDKFGDKQLAIQELEKVKNFLFDMQAPVSIIDGIDQQIKKLENKNES